MNESILIIAVYAVITIFSVISFWHIKTASPIFWHPIFLFIMAVGTFPLLNLSTESDLIYMINIFVAVISFSITANIFVCYFDIKAIAYQYRRSKERENSSDERLLTYFIFAMAVIATFLYYYTVGFNTIFSLYLASTDSEYSTLRLSMYATGPYYYPGYVNQFKNVLLPVCFVAITMWLYKAKLYLRLTLFFILFFPFLCLALLGTGQRMFIISSMLSIVFGVSLIRWGANETILLTKALVFGVFVTLVFLFILTAKYKGFELNDFTSVFKSIIQRALFTQQEGGLIGFRYIDGLDTVWFSDWRSSIIGLLPGVKKIGIAHYIHYLAYGTARGTIPLTTIGSAYYNGGTLCVILFFSFLGFAYTFLYYRFLRGERTVLRCLIYGSLFLTLSSFVAGDPTALVEDGVITLVIFLLVLKFRLVALVVPQESSKLGHRWKSGKTYNAQ